MEIDLVNLTDIENILQTYTLEEILELNDLSEVDVLMMLVRLRHIKLPNPSPLDVP